jgi:Fe-S-cluster-containing dehydrogenase component
MCGDRKSQGKLPFCMLSCPAHAIIHGNIEDPTSSIAQKRDELRSRNYRELTMPAWENTRQPVYYYTNR